MIISFFGPDGVGKSTIANVLAEHGCMVFSGTNVASWPDKSWHDELTANGIDESALDKDEHFLEKIARAHRLAAGLSQDHEIVVIDSDPIHKTLTHDYLRLLPDVSRGRKLMRERFADLKGVAGYEGSTPLLHAYCQLSDTLSEVQQAQILHDRVSGRTERAYFDPKDLQGAIDRIQACRALKELLEASAKKYLLSRPANHLTSRSSNGALKASVKRKQHR